MFFQNHNTKCIPLISTPLLEIKACNQPFNIKELKESYQFLSGVAFAYELANC